jgi:hypothetical protein
MQPRSRTDVSFACWDNLTSLKSCTTQNFIEIKNEETGGSLRYTWTMSFKKVC